MFKIILTKQAIKDQSFIEEAGLKSKVKRLINVLKVDPFQKPPAYEKLVGNLSGYFSRRINLQHRLIYQVIPNTDKSIDNNGIEYEGYVKIIRMWTHYSGVR